MILTTSIHLPVAKTQIIWLYLIVTEDRKYKFYSRWPLDLLKVLLLLKKKVGVGKLGNRILMEVSFFLSFLQSWAKL